MHQCAVKYDAAKTNPLVSQQGVYFLLHFDSSLGQYFQVKHWALELSVMPAC